jgi:hypothetical protein
MHREATVIVHHGTHAAALAGIRERGLVGADPEWPGVWFARTEEFAAYFARRAAGNHGERRGAIVTVDLPDAIPTTYNPRLCEVHAATPRISPNHIAAVRELAFGPEPTDGDREALEAAMVASRRITAECRANDEARGLTLREEAQPQSGALSRHEGLHSAIIALTLSEETEERTYCSCAGCPNCRRNQYISDHSCVRAMAKTRTVCMDCDPNPLRCPACREPLRSDDMNEHLAACLALVA